MTRGERVSRAYVTAVLVVQAVVAFATDLVDGTEASVLLLASLSLLLPLVDRDPSVVLRSVTVWPAVVASLVWAWETASLGLVAWGAWSLVVVWTCHPAGTRARATLAERFHAATPRHTERRTGERRSTPPPAPLAG